MSPSGQDGYFLPPREDVNSPDMYIPGQSHHGSLYLPKFKKKKKKPRETPLVLMENPAS